MWNDIYFIFFDVIRMKAMKIWLKEDTTNINREKS